MKKVFFLVLLTSISMVACKPKTEEKQADPDLAKEEVLKTMDDFYTNYNAKNLEAVLDFLHSDGLYCGTDPEELWDSAEFANAVTGMFADTNFLPNLKVDKRELRLQGDGSTAIVADQFFVMWSSRIPVRNVYHMVKQGDVWKCNFSSMGIIPQNEDLSSIFKPEEIPAD